MLIECKILYPNIYKPAIFNRYGKYQIGFKTDIHLAIRPNKNEIYNASSKFAPMILADKYSVLVEAIEIAKARNIEPDRLFRDVNAGLQIGYYEYSSHGYSGTGMRLENVFIDADDIYFNATNIGHEEE